MTREEFVNKVVLVFLGGGIGSVARYGSTLLAVRLGGTAFPWGTLAVNLTGCLTIGLLFGVSEREGLLGPSARLFLVTGCMGGLTTFPTYALESTNFARSGSFFGGVANLFASNAAGLFLVMIGLWLAHKLIPGG